MIKNKIALFVIFSLILIGCKETTSRENDDNSIAEQKVDNEALLQELKSKAEVFTINKDTLVTIKGEQGTLFRFSPDIFIHTDDSEVTEQITIELTECFAPSELIFNNLSTETTKEELLATKGMVNIKAFSKGKELKVKEGKNYEVGFPLRNTQKEKDYRLFDGHYKEDTKCVKWEETALEFDDTKYGTMIYKDTIGVDLTGLAESMKHSLEYYLFKSSNLGWLNCDKYISKDNNNASYMIVNVDSFLKPVVNIMYKSFKTMSPGELINNNQFRFSPLEIGSDVIIFGFSKVGDKIYLGQKEVVLSENLEINLEFKEVTLEELKTASEALEWESI